MTTGFWSTKKCRISPKISLSYNFTNSHYFYRRRRGFILRGSAWGGIGGGMGFKWLQAASREQKVVAG
jgi:hypothetical protein